MSGFTLAYKKSQSQMFDTEGKRIPVTHLLTSPCYLIDMKSPTSHGYMSVTVGFGQTKNIKKPTAGRLKKAGVEAPLRFLKEFRLESIKDSVKEVEENNKKGIQIGEAKIMVGEEIKPALLFKEGDSIDVSGTSKGKGFQGVVRRHGFAGGPKTHGQSDRWRAPGSIGQTTTPGRVYKGKRMAGRMGGGRVTIQNLKVVKVDDQGLIIKGLVPGFTNGLLEVRTSDL